MGNTISKNPHTEMVGKKLSDFQEVLHEESTLRDSFEIHKLNDVCTRMLDQGLALSRILDILKTSGYRQEINEEVWKDCEKALKSVGGRFVALKQRVSVLEHLKGIKVSELARRRLFRGDLFLVPVSLRSERQALDCRALRTRRGSAHF